MQYKRIVSWLEHESGLSEEEETKAKALRLAAHLNLAMCFLKLQELNQVLENCDKVKHEDISIPVSNNCILFVQVHVMFIFYSINRSNFYNLGKIRPLYLTAELAL